MDKPFKGRLRDWFKHPYGDQFYICGFFDGHPDFHRKWGHTSLVLEMVEIPRHLDEPRKFHIETLNSQYELIGDETTPPTR